MITAQKGDKVRRFGVLQWNRLVKANQTDGWVEVKSGAQPPRSGTPGASPNKAFSPPEVTNFPLKTRQETEAEIRAQVEGENKGKLEEMAAEIARLKAGQGNQAPAPAVTETPAPKVETPSAPAQNKAKTDEADAAAGKVETPAAGDQKQGSGAGAGKNPNQGAGQNKAGQGNQASGGKGTGK